MSSKDVRNDFSTLQETQDGDVLRFVLNKTVGQCFVEKKLFVNHWGLTSTKSSVAKKVQNRRSTAHTSQAFPQTMMIGTTIHTQSTHTAPTHYKARLPLEHKPAFIKLAAHRNVPTTHAQSPTQASSGM
ncbi:hypothetical protein MTO96_007426 [Rhipicephalus appendiculatus]